jgi:hypothetical protein
MAPQVFYDVITDGLFASSAYKVYGKILYRSSSALATGQIKRHTRPEGA